VQTEDMRLDGNAVGGTLSEVFAREVTAALATCIACGTVAALGALHEYGQAMGVILRCPACETTMLRIVRTPGSLWVDASGMALLIIPAGASTS
jgi:hypothetical protein